MIIGLPQGCLARELRQCKSDRGGSGSPTATCVASSLARWGQFRRNVSALNGIDEADVGGLMKSGIWRYDEVDSLETSIQVELLDEPELLPSTWLLGSSRDRGMISIGCWYSRRCFRR